MQRETAHSRTRFIGRFGGLALACMAAGAALPGCGNVLYAYRANSASVKLEEARQAGAEKTALYEYTLAREHLTKAMSEASEADYGDAYELAQLADGFAAQAVEKARLRMRATPQAAAQTPASLEQPPSATEPSTSTTSGSPEAAKAQEQLDVNAGKK